MGLCKVLQSLDTRRGSTLPLGGVVPLQSCSRAQTPNVPPGDKRIDKNRPQDALHAASPLEHTGPMLPSSSIWELEGRAIRDSFHQSLTILLHTGMDLDLWLREWPCALMGAACKLLWAGLRPAFSSESRLIPKRGLHRPLSG